MVSDQRGERNRGCEGESIPGSQQMNMAIPIVSGQHLKIYGINECKNSWKSFFQRKRYMKYYSETCIHVPYFLLWSYISFGSNKRETREHMCTIARVHKFKANIWEEDISRYEPRDTLSDNLRESDHQ